jgi:hypothetical protein
MQNDKPNMIRKILFSLALISVVSVITVQAEPTPTPKAKGPRTKTIVTSKIVPAAPLPEGWSLANGVWVHSDGYKYVNGQVIKTGTQTHKRPPKPPTKALMDAATKKPGPKTPADAAAAKAAERERNLAPRPAPQTGTHM